MYRARLLALLWGCPDWLGLSLCCVSLVVGCAGTVPTCKVPTAVEVEIETSDRLNADAEGRSLPTLVRLYQLKDLSAFQMAEFADIWQNAKETLGATLLAVKELTTYPGQVVVERIERDEKADYLVGVGIFRSPIGSTWRTVSELPLPGDPCQEKDDEKAAPMLEDLRLRMFLEDYRIESVDNYAALPKRSCGGKANCQQQAAPNELPEERRHGRLRTFEEDPSRAKPTVTDDSK
ncbi:MAG TPA: type VI secretion system lipoprotein TssJ [Polyangiales bacterium]|nr:type VI secretion system lipoprotein TssJ [Polyangiales bacterium]